MEYSANLDERLDIDGLCARIHETLLATGVFELAAIRVRALRADSYAVADRLPENSFLDISLRMGQGRTTVQRREIGEAVYATALAAVRPLLSSQHFALSFEIREIDSDMSWKTNGFRARLLEHT